MRVGGICAGYGGLELATRMLWTEATPVWFSEIDETPARILSTRFPDVPNVGDITAIDEAPACDVITAGFPCQPASAAGKRAGMADDRWIWPAINRVIRNTTPGLVLLENVRGLLTVNGGAAWDQVRTDLEAGGYHVRWSVVKASDVGACHQRARLFVAAVRDGWTPPAPEIPRGLPITGPPRVLLPTPSAEESTPTDEYVAEMVAAGIRPDERLYLPGRAWHSQRTLSRIAPLLPTPNAWDGSRGPDLARANRPDSGGMDLTTTVERLLPTPTAQDSSGSRRATARTDQWKPNPGTTLTDVAYADTFGEYAGAVTRHTMTMRRYPPAPTEPDTNRLAPAFVEWMMMLPAGWVTDIPDITRAKRLRALGNGVVPLQAAAAYHRLLTEPDPEQLTLIGG